LTNFVSTPVARWRNGRGLDVGWQGLWQAPAVLLDLHLDAGEADADLLRLHRTRGRTKAKRAGMLLNEKGLWKGSHAHPARGSSHRARRIAIDFGGSRGQLRERRVNVSCESGLP